ncbi:uncharacterized protein LOC142338513 [Convolutriloba macropyga]|uniref:uncharacterized protein LOC142338513 n=1 Tax=Convolutriloba macropyga TaxID=536237 RepID=UPI003F5226CA
MASWAEKTEVSQSRTGSVASTNRGRNSAAVVLEENPAGAELDFGDTTAVKHGGSASSNKSSAQPQPDDANQEERSVSKVENIARQRQSAQSKKSAKSQDPNGFGFDEDDDGDPDDEVQFAENKGGADMEEQSIERPESGRSRVSFAAIVLQARPRLGKSKEDEIDQSIVDEPVVMEKKEKKPSKAVKLCKTIFKWFRLLLQLVIVSGVVVLCIISAVLSFMKFIETSGQPASIYKPQKMTGPHEAPGLIFVGVDLELESCEMFNFTSLDINSLEKNETCDPVSIVLQPSDPLTGEVASALPAFLTGAKQRGDTIQMHLVRGPSLWMYKQATTVHLTIPKTDTGTWGILHHKYTDAQADFETAILGTASERWKLAEVLILGFSMNFVATNYQSVFLMSRQDFMEMGVTQATRTDMEISLLGMDEDALNDNIGQFAINATRAHMQALFQWKDGYYMEGDTFMATSPFQIVTVISGVLLMLERAYNTFMRLYTAATKKKKAKQEDDATNQQQQDKDQTGQAPNAKNNEGKDGLDTSNDDEFSKPGSRMQTPLIKVDEPGELEDDLGGQQNFGYIPENNDGGLDESYNA